MATKTKTEIRGIKPPHSGYQRCVAPKGCWMRTDRLGCTWFARPYLEMTPDRVVEDVHMGFLPDSPQPDRIAWEEECGEPPPVRPGHQAALAIIGEMSA